MRVLKLEKLVLPSWVKVVTDQFELEKCYSRLKNISPHVVSDPQQRRRSMCCVAVFAQARRQVVFFLFAI